MNYCSKQKMIDLFGELELIQRTDRDNLGVVDDAVLAQALNDADAEINGYLTRYPLPLAVVPSNFARLAADIARHYLYKDHVTGPVQARYDGAVKYLAMVARGTITLPAAADGAVPTPSGGGVMIASAPAVFGRGP